MSVKEINPKETTRASAFELWMEAPNPMVTFFKTYDVMPLIKVSKKYDMKFNMLLDFCIGKAAASVKEFYLLPVGNKLIQYDKLAVNTIQTKTVRLVPAILPIRTTSKSSMPITCDIQQKYKALVLTMTYPKNTWLSVHLLL